MGRIITHYTLIFLTGKKKISIASKINYFSLNPYSRCQPATVLQATTTLINLSIAQSLRVHYNSHLKPPLPQPAQQTGE